MQCSVLEAIEWDCPVPGSVVLVCLCRVALCVSVSTVRVSRWCGRFRRKEQWRMGCHPTPSLRPSTPWQPRKVRGHTTWQERQNTPRVRGNSLIPCLDFFPGISRIPVCLKPYFRYKLGYCMERHDNWSICICDTVPGSSLIHSFSFYPFLPILLGIYISCLHWCFTFQFYILPQFDTKYSSIINYQ